MKIKLIGIVYTRIKYLCHQITRSNRYKLTRRLIRHIESSDCDLPAKEKIILKKILSKTLVSQINYPFMKEYNYRIVPVLRDKTKSLYYVRHNKKKLYFKRGLSKMEIRNMYNGLCLEQDARSPHSYFAFSIRYRPTDIAADIGAAEGIWALDIVENVREIYLFECEADWVEALQATFEPWKDKVRIVNKYVSDFNDEKNTTLDDYFYNKNLFPDIIKVDIEGAEVACMQGASKLLTRPVRHLLLCTYHNYSDFSVLSEIMKSHHFEVQPSEGYMIPVYTEPDYSCKDITKLIRKGLIHAYKQETT